jgi:hemolysin D
LRPNTARSLLWTLVLLVMAASVWAGFGHLDVVATAPARLVPRGRVKVVQAFEQSVIQRIHVREGQGVTAGTLLISLDPTAPLADEARLREDLLMASLARARLRHLSARGPMGDPFASLAAEIPAPLIDEARALLEQQEAERTLTLQALAGEAAGLEARRREAAAELAGLTAELPLADATLAGVRDLAAEGYLPRAQAAHETRAHYTLLARHMVTRRRIEALDAQLLASRTRLEATRAGFAQRWLAELAELESRLLTLEAELSKARRRVQLTRLMAPVDGTVQELAVHAAGAVVAPGVPLMRLIPLNAVLEAEAHIPHRDIGFVRAGQAALVKLSAFEFTRHGHLRGEVKWVARDATNDAQGNSYYPARIVLPDGAQSHTGGPLALRAGMAASVDVHLGRRRIADFLLGPLQQRVLEAARER